MPQLDPSSFASQIFWLIVSFSLLYLVLSRTLLPRITEVLQNRETKIASDLEKAETLKLESDKLRHAYEAALSKARQEASVTMKKMSDHVEKLHAERHAKLDQSLQIQLQEAETRILKTRDAALKEMEVVETEIAQEMLSKLLGKRLDKETVARSLHLLSSRRA